MSPASPSLALAFGLAFEDLYQRPGLERIDASFDTFLAGADAALHERYRAARADPAAIDAKAEAELKLLFPEG